MFKNFEEDINAKTPSYFLKDIVGGIEIKQQKELVALGQKLKKTVRLCLHQSSDDLLQVMCIYHPEVKEIPVKKYLHQDSIYMILDGILELKLLDESFVEYEKIVLSKEAFIMYRIPKNQLYHVCMMSPAVLFLEIRNGPFIKEEQIVIER